MSLLASVEVVPIHAQVCLVDSTWQDYPQWESGEEPVAFRAPSLTDPEHPPYPGFAVATRSDVSDGHLRTVVVELHADLQPLGMTNIHTSVLYVGRAGVSIGNEDSGLTQVNLASGSWPIDILVDSTDPSNVGRVAFVIATR